MERLLTSGCSFTKHCWPSWADYLGKHYVWHKNVAEPGSDNARIARSVIQNAKPDDLVVILWSGYDRFSRYSDDEWHHTGSLVGDKEFYTNYYSQVERFTTTMDYVQMVDFHAKLKGYKCYHFNAFNWFGSETYENVDSAIPEIYNNYSIDNSYFTKVKCMYEFQEKRNEVIKINHKYIKNDIHPTPITHWYYLKEVMAEIIGVEIDTSLESTVLADQDRVLAGDVD